MGPKLSLTLFLFVQPLALVFAAHHDTVSINWHGNETRWTDRAFGVTQAGIQPGATEKTTRDRIEAIHFPLSHVIEYYDSSLLFEVAFHMLFAVFAFRRSRRFALSQFFYGLFAISHHISHHHLTVRYMYWPTHYFFLIAMLLQPLSNGKPIRLRDFLTTVCIDTLGMIRPEGSLWFLPQPALSFFLFLWIQWDNRAFRSWFLLTAPILLGKVYQCEFMHTAPHNEFDFYFSLIFSISCICLAPFAVIDAKTLFVKTKMPAPSAYMKLAQGWNPFLQY